MVLTEGWDCPRSVVHPGAADEEDGALPADDRPGAASRRARPTRSSSTKRRRLPARFRRGSGRVDARSRGAPRAQPMTRAAERIAAALECTQCGAIRIAGHHAPRCGFRPAPPRDVPTRDGELGLYRAGATRRPGRADPLARHAHAHRPARGYKAGWIAYKFKEKFGAFPHWPPTRSRSRHHPKSRVGCVRA